MLEVVVYQKFLVWRQRKCDKQGHQGEDPLAEDTCEKYDGDPQFDTLYSSGMSHKAAAEQTMLLLLTY